MLKIYIKMSVRQEIIGFEVECDPEDAEVLVRAFTVGLPLDSKLIYLSISPIL
jgi:hypothetical protein